MKRNFFHPMLFLLVTMPLFVACGKDSDNDAPSDETSLATLEYLCSRLIWTYAPDEGVKKGESYNCYSFYSFAGENGCTISNVGDSGELSGYYDLSYTPPTVTLKEKNTIGKENKGRSVTLTVYKLTKKGYSQSYLLINGKTYIGTAGDGIYQE